VSDTGPSFSLKIPHGEDRERRVCDTCGFVDYVNPRLVAGAVAAWSGGGAPFGPGAAPPGEIRILLCRRAIHPRKGWWTLPAGFMESGETVAEAVRREAWEEARAELALDALLAVYDVPHISQVQMFHRAALVRPDVTPGPESLETTLFSWEEIPWDALAFPSVRWSLEAFAETRELAAFQPRGNPPGA
jgi:ADP-ribose pyrophosphatase YjhB (NUDIX family)